MTAIINPGLGLYLGQSPLATPRGGVQDGVNFRIKYGKLSNLNLGWLRFSANFTLNGPVTFIDNFFPRGLTEHLMFGTETDIYRYDSGTDNVVFLTPRYEAGTAAASGTAVTGTSTLWTTAGIKAGDEITFGTAGVTDPAATWFTVLSVGGETSITLTTSAGTVADGPYTIRRKFQGLLSDGWSFDVFVDDTVSGDDLWLGTNGVDSVVSWDGSATQMTLHPEFGFTCKVVAVANNMAIYADYVESGIAKPTSFQNSAVGSPLAVGAVGTGLANAFRVHSGTDNIVNIVPLGDNLVFYSGRHITLAQFVGDPLVFVFRQAVEGIGAVGHDAIADFGDFHSFLSQDAQYEFDGVTIKESNSHVWRDLIRQADPKRLFRIQGHFDEENGDLIWSVPLNTDADAGNIEGQSEYAFSEHYLEDVPDQAAGQPYSKREFPFTATGFYQRDTGLTWADMTQAWSTANFQWNDQFFAADFPQNLVGDKNGIIWLLGESQQKNGVDMVSFVKFGREATGDGKARNLLTRIYPYTQQQASGQLEIRVYMLDHASAPPVLTDTLFFDLTLPEGAHFVAPYRVGRFAEIRFGSSGDPWTLEGFDLEIRPGGRR